MCQRVLWLKLQLEKIMSRVSDLQIEAGREPICEPVSRDDWTIRELTSLINEYRMEPGHEEFIGLLLRAKTNQEDF